MNIVFLFIQIGCIPTLFLLNGLFFLFSVMLMGTLVYGIRYTIPEYVCTLLVAGGVSTFALLKVRIRCISYHWWNTLV